MNLTLFTDYSLRILIYTATKPAAQRSNIQEIADVYHISKNHLMKSVHKLGQLGVLETARGRGGGFRLAKSPSEINLGWVIRQIEENWHIAECFDAAQDRCVISPACHLQHVLGEALQAYLKVLDGYTLADIVVNRDQLASQLGLQQR